jgi:deazaflavin-dependent oxidoreductase (nitroreductase family)
MLTPGAASLTLSDARGDLDERNSIDMWATPRGRVIAFAVVCAAIVWLARARSASDATHRGSDSADDHAMFTIPRSGWLIAIFHAPRWLYHVGLGGLFGHRLLLLKHRGRRTGKEHETILEVAHFDPTTRESVVVSAWGSRADWYRNIQAHAPVEVQTGYERYAPVWRDLQPDEKYMVVRDYMRRLPWPLRPLARRFGLEVGRTEPERRAHAQQLIMVGLRPAHAASEGQPWLRTSSALPRRDADPSRG